ncbi:MAG: hypothetical protein KIT09_16600 [Bryobacteraceae bacterium]|nr:hypothetical protein [Bryobacteraceae bacterium]
MRPSQPNNLIWTTWKEALRVVGHPPFLKKTTLTAITVGLILLLINHFDEVLS